MGCRHWQRTDQRQAIEGGEDWPLRSWRRIRMLRAPVPGNVLTFADPHIVVLHDVIQKPFQPGGTARVPDDPHV